MTKKDQAARERIIKTATEIVQEVSDIEKITVRQIAERANVGIGTINYHFNSKDNLLGMAVGNLMANRINDFSKLRDMSELQPIQKLKTMLNEVCNIAVANQTLIRFMLIQGILNGDMQTPLYLIPFLKEIFGDEKEEFELRLIATQILHPIQIAGISPDAFHLYSGVDMYDRVARNGFIDMLIDNVVVMERGDKRCKR